MSLISSCDHVVKMACFVSFRSFNLGGLDNAEFKRERQIRRCTVCTKFAELADLLYVLNLLKWKTKGVLSRGGKLVGGVNIERSPSCLVGSMWDLHQDSLFPIVQIISHMK